MPVPTLPEILADPESAPLPENKEEQYSIYHEIAKAGEAHLDGCVIYALRLPKGLAFLVMRSLYMKYGTKISCNKNWGNWFESNTKFIYDAMSTKEVMDLREFLSNPLIRS